MISSPSEIARRLADAFESGGIPYAVGGALALGVWGFPRATLDVDINVFVAPEDLASIYEILRKSGCSLDEASSTKRAIEDGQFEAHVGPMRIDVFIPSIPFYENVRRRIRQGPLEGRSAWYLSPEDLTVMKLLFFRPKDLLDIERLVAIRGTDFDRRYVRVALQSLVGADDARCAEWDRLLERAGG